MSNIFGEENQLKVFKCPNCKEYISSNNKFCPKCSFQISEDQKQTSINAEIGEVKEENRKFYKSLVYSGLGFLILGGGVVFYTVFSMLTTGEGRFFIWSPVIAFLGFGQIIYGLNGIRKER